MASTVLSPILTRLFNHCIENQLYPLDLKKAVVIPIFKKGRKDLSGNYRPISLISPFSKVFEKCLLSQLTKFFTKNGLLSKRQFGFKKSVSTEMALCNVYEDLIKNSENDKITCSVFLDISKAFDSVDHEILLSKLQFYGVRGLPLELLRSYLNDRYQCTMVDGETSDFLPISCGVPQGSVLAPFLFSIFTNDLPNSTIMETTLFADDACFNYGHKCPTLLQKIVNTELEKISKWYYNNKLSLNADKSNFILIHKRKQQINVKLKLNEINLEQKHSVKYLGITIDDRLTWKPHINNCLQKLNKCLFAIYKLRPYVSLPTLKLVYNSLAYPHLQYCLSIWGGASPTSLKPLLIKQKRIIRAMLFEPNISPSSPLFFKLNLLKLDEIYSFKLGLLMHKQINVKNSLELNFPLISSVHGHSTRLSIGNNFYIQTVNTDLGKTAFSYSAPKNWNSIPNDVRTSSTFSFKFVYKKYLLNRYLPTP